MIEWSEQHLMIRDMVRRFVAAEVVPNHKALEHGDLPPYDIMRKLASTLGVADAARMRYEAMKRRAQKDDAARAAGEAVAPRPESNGGDMTCFHRCRPLTGAG